MPELRARGVRVHYQRAGTGPETVVMIHGMLVDNLSSLYYTTAPAAVDRMDVLLYDLRGHGRSERPATGYRVVDAIADLRAILDVLNIDGPVHLLGNSYGGTIALATAHAHPELVASLVLIEAHFSLAGWGVHIAKDLELAGFGLNEDDLQVWLDAQGGRKLNRLAKGAETLISQTSLIDDLADAPPLYADDLRGIACPALAIYGEHSDVIDRAHDLEALLPHCELSILLDCSHSVLLEATPTVRGLVRDWFTSRLAGEPMQPGSRKLRVGEGEGSGAEHRGSVDFYRAELERRRALDGVQ